MSAPSASPLSAAAFREELEELIRRDLLGPAAGDKEVITESSVRDRYLLGMLGPLKVVDVEEEPFEELADSTEDTLEEGTAEPSTPPKRSVAPSSFGLSFCLAPSAETFEVEAKWGQYLREQDPDGKPVWQRYPRGGKKTIPVAEGEISEWSPDAESPAVVVRGRIRKRANHWSVTVFLSNEQDEGRPRDMYWLLQAGLHITGDLTRRPGEGHVSTLDDVSRMEDRTNEMLYRRELEFARGHGVSVDWNLAEGQWDRATEVWTTAMPKAVVRSVDQPGVPGLVIDMKDLAESSDAELTGKLRPLAVAYGQWIDELEVRAKNEPDLQTYQDAANDVITRARNVFQRLNDGIAVLESSAEARDAFRFANEAMWRQRVRSVWIEEKKAQPGAAIADVDIPKNRSWRAFQLAFLLLNLSALASVEHPDRDPGPFAGADLLWFPTGGGKTEAYLGLAAFAIGIRRLQKDLGGRDGENGMAVLMRYTLRLLTLQQFQRAATLICACEQIRLSNTEKWGQAPFRLGLWVGRKTTPNRTSQAAEVIEALKGSKRPVFGQGTPHQFPFCPWCGAAIDPGKHIVVEMYPAGRARTLIYCGDPLGQCEFSRRQSPDEGLPLLVVDEEIYRRPPAMMIATVDKFAQMAWQGQVQTLFGQVNGYCPRHGFRSPELEDTNSHQAAGKYPPVATQPHALLRPPDLIIQDELHLISGPLGSLVGIYEGAIDLLSTWEVNGRKVRPKVIASTATVRRAPAQVSALFNRSVRVFPPPGLEAGANFFSRELPVSDTAPGRLYVGLCGPGKRIKGSLIRTYVAALAAGQTLYEKYGDAVDSFLTAVGYFSSLRELGGMRRLVDDDVRSRLTQVQKRGLSKRNLRLPGAVEELTSRKSATDIPTLLEKMKQRFPPLGQKAGQIPLDVLLATNMISVGVDVARLGLMIVAGQPKSTAEYIQATSRVGRSSPGLVLTVYNWARPRDLSHFEGFRPYHATFYRQVEALSVTPYSTGAIDRALTGVLVSAIRQASFELNRNVDAQDMQKAKASVKAALAYLPVRAAEAGTGGPSLQTFVDTALQQRLDKWWQRAKKMVGGARLGYQDGKDGVTTALIRMPGTAEWTDFTVLNSLRDVEPEADFVFNDDGMDSVLVDDQAGATQ